MVSLLDAFNEWLNPKPKRTYVNLREKREQDLMKIHLLAKFGKMFALALLLASPASAELVGAQFRDFSGGLNDSADATAIPPNQSPDLLNLVVDDPAGAAKPRGGFTTCGKLPSGNSPTELYNYSKTDGTQYLIATDNTNIYQTGDCTTWTRIVTNLTAANKPSFSTIRNDLWFVNGSTWAYKWDGSTTTQIDGSFNTPNPAPPRGRYIEFWRERVWIAATSGDPSIVAWSALTDSAGNDITPSTGTGAWPATNALYVDRDGGSRIYGIKAYRDNLYVFKGNGIWRIVFNNDFDIAVVKTLSSVGSRFGSSIVELDNMLYFVGPDGIYSFDGDNSVRLSDRIYQKFQSIRQPLSAEGVKIWNDEGDFDDGTTNQTTFEDLPGSVILSTNALVEDCEDGSLTPNWKAVTGWVCSAGQIAAPSASSMYADSPVSTGIYTFRGHPEGAGTILEVKFISVGTDRTGSAGYAFRLSVNGAYTAMTPQIIEYPANTAILTCPDLSSPSADRTWSIERSTSGIFVVKEDGDEYCSVTDATVVGSSVAFLYTNQGIAYISSMTFVEYKSSGVYTTQIYEGVSLSSWSLFDADSNANEGSIVYSIRVGSHATAVENASYVTITPGSLIPGATWQNFVQIKATFTAHGAFKTTPYLNSLTVSYIKGGSQTQTIYGGRWKNRYWVSASTGSSGSNDMVLVNGRFDKSSWVPYDLQVGPFVTFNDNFYAGASTYSAVQRMDYGTNDAGAAINWYWTSRDEAFGQPLNRKRLMEISTDFRRASGASSVAVGYSRDQGATFTNSSFSMSGTGRDTDTRYVNGQNSFDFRLRFGSTSLDVAPTIIGITGWANIQPGRQ